MRLHVDVAGPPDGVPVVFLHGVSGSMRTYAWLPEEITEGRRVVRVDLRGHGRSEHAPGAYDVDSYGEDVVQALRETGGRPAVLVGHSLGGVVAWRVAQGHPELVTAAFLEDPPLYMGEPAEHELNGAVPIFRAILDTVARWKADGVGADAAAAQLAAAPFGPDRSRTSAEGLGDDVPAARAEALLQMDPGVLEGAADRSTLAPTDTTSPGLGARLRAGRRRREGRGLPDAPRRAPGHLAPRRGDRPRRRRRPRHPRRARPSRRLRRRAGRVPRRTRLSDSLLGAAVAAAPDVLRRRVAQRKASACAAAHCSKVRGSRPRTSRTVGWTCDSSREPST